MKKTLVIFIALYSLSTTAFASDKLDDGEYDASVTTDSGSYQVRVEVEDGEVTIVHWPNGGDMNLSGAELDYNEATGTNSNGDTIHIEIDE